MLSISSEYELSLNENSNQLIKAKITFADNTVRQLTGDDIVSCSFDQQVSSDSSFDIGTAIIGQMTITLNNHDGRFDACDFTKAQFVVWVGKQLSKGTEWIQRGIYTANQPDSYNGTIAISALDNMSKFEKPFRTFLASVGALQGANASVRTLLTDMCSHCGVTWVDSGDKAFDTKFEYGYVDSSATCRQALAHACQALCVNASITNDGRLRTVWYDSAPFEAESDLDGGEFDAAKPYATGASEDGGNFTDYSSGASADGGTFFTNKWVHRLFAFSNITVNTDDVVITGVRVTERSVTVGNKTTNGGIYTVGTEGYVLDVSRPHRCQGHRHEVQAVQRQAHLRPEPGGGGLRLRHRPQAECLQDLRDSREVLRERRHDSLVRSQEREQEQRRQRGREHVSSGQGA